MYQVEQYVMAYSGDHDEIKKLLPEGYESLRPVLRINVEVVAGQEGEGETIYIEFNTPVAACGKRGWLNLTVWKSSWADIFAVRDGNTARFTIDSEGTEVLEIAYTATGKEGGCPREDDNDGTFFIDAFTGETEFREAERIDEKKEYCDCRFAWTIPEGDDFAEKPELARRAMGIPRKEVLGAYVVRFRRESLEAFC